MTAKLGALALTLTLLLSGCIGAGSDLEAASTGPVDVEDLLPVGLPIEMDHDHADPLAHQDAANMELVDHDILLDEDEFGSLGYAEVWTCEDLALVAIHDYESSLPGASPQQVPDTEESTDGFFVVDISDPTDVSVIGRYLTHGLKTYDVKTSPDCQWAFLGTQTLGSPAAVGGDERELFGPGVQMVSLEDPTEPRFVSYGPVPPRGTHNVNVHERDDGRLIVASTSANFISDPTGLVGLSTDPTFTAVRLFEADPDAGELTYLSDYRIFLEEPVEFMTDQGTINDIHYVHDMWMEQHPVTGEELLYVAHWEAGMRVVNIDDPSEPVEIGFFKDKGPAEYLNAHYVQPAPDLIDGRHITIVAPELLTSQDSGWLHILDTTDPANPERVALWELPGNVVNTETLLFSPHNLDIDHGRVYVGHYHAGVWVLDLEHMVREGLGDEAPDQAWLERASLGFYLPHGSDAFPIEQGTQYTDDTYFGAGVVPNVWGAVYQDGYIFASDISSGFYVLRFDGDPLPSAADVLADGTAGDEDGAAGDGA